MCHQDVAPIERHAFEEIRMFELKYHRRADLRCHQRLNLQAEPASGTGSFDYVAGQE
jgi:hypothetical protein